jgi:hypothetical protein
LPTFESLPGFKREYGKLTTEQQAAFKAVVTQFVADLRSGRGFRRSLRVKTVQGVAHVWEITWAADGRATWQYGEQQIAGEPHIVWRRIGTHSIFKQP